MMDGNRLIRIDEQGTPTVVQSMYMKKGKVVVEYFNTFKITFEPDRLGLTQEATKEDFTRRVERRAALYMVMDHR